MRSEDVVVRPKSHSLVASRPVYHGKGRRAVGQHPIWCIHRGRSQGHKYLRTMELKLSQETTSDAWKHSCCRSRNSQAWGITWVCSDIEGLYHSLFTVPSSPYVRTTAYILGEWWSLQMVNTAESPPPKQGKSSLRQQKGQIHAGIYV